MSSSVKVNLQSLIEDWGYCYFQQRATWKERKLLKKEHIETEIDWKRVRFVHDDPVYEPDPNSTRALAHPVSNLLFSTEFTNRTDAAQTYTFRTERTTRSSCTVNIEQCYTFGMDMNFKLTTPNDILELNVGFKREMALTNSEAETIEEELMWGVDSQIEVKAGHLVKAKLCVAEVEYDGSFSVETKISGRVRVIFRNAKDGHSFIKAVEGDIFEIVRQASHGSGSGTRGVIRMDNTTRTVHCWTKGKCKFKYGVKQVIEVDQLPLKS